MFINPLKKKENSGMNIYLGLGHGMMEYWNVDLKRILFI
jgi:hypothetical protein